MGFTAVTIVAPNVPDGADPLTYFTAKPRDKAQELAQQQAQSAGLALFGGAPGLDASTHAEDAEDSSLSAPTVAAEPPAPSLTVEEKQAAQDAKTCIIPRAASVTKPAASQNLDYAYLYPNARLRAVPQLLGDPETSGPEPVPRTTSHVASTPAPILRPSLPEMMDEPPFRFLQKVAAQYKEYGMVKIVPPRGFPRDELPFGQDVLFAFKSEKQVFMSPGDAAAFSARTLRKGFFRAVLRFHATTPIDKGKRRMQKLPSFERKPVDLYRLFRSVRVRGGLDQVVKRKEWAQVGRELGYASQALPTLSSTLRQAYIRAIQPFEAFLEQHGVSLQADILPRLDVEDEDRPAKPRSGVRVLPNGIIVESQSTDPLPRDRKIVVMDESRNQGPSVTLKSFRQRSNLQASANADLPIEEKEARYWKLPAYFETEQLASKPGVRVLPFPEPFAANTFLAPAMNRPLSPWNLARLSLHDDALARFVHEDIDDFVIPQLHIGQQFATQDWATADMAAYRMSLLVEGTSRTWYTDNNVFADQRVGEFILVFPTVRAMNWCHGLSVAESVSLFPYFDWLTRALSNEMMNQPQRFCVQRLVYEASRSALRPEAQKEVLHAIQVLHEKERAIVDKLGHLRKAEPDTAAAALGGSPSITCAVTGAKRYWSWVLVDGETWSPEAVLERKPAQNNLVFVRRYDDVDDFFASMVESLNTASSKACEWHESVTRTLRSDELPKESALQLLAQSVPDSTEDKVWAAYLVQTVTLMQKWLHLETSNKCKKLDELRVAYNEMVGCVDDAEDVEAARKRAMSKGQSIEDFWNSFIATLNAGSLPDAGAFQQMEALAARYPTIQPFIHLLREIVEWARMAARKVRELPVDLSALMALKEQGSRLIPSTSQAIVKIDLQLNWGVRKIADIESFMAKPEAFDGEAIRYYQKSIEINTLPFESRDKFLVLVYNLPLIDRMAGGDLVKRPRQQEAEVLQAFPAFAFAMNKLGQWLVKAQTLDWLLIVGQLQKLTSGAPIVPLNVTERIPMQRLLDVRQGMYELKIVPDDIELVQKTIEDTMRVLDAASPEQRQAYGFDP